MGFNIMAFLIAMGVCLVSMIIAGASGSKEDKEWFANLKHPDNSFLLKIMTILGVVVYLIFGFVLYFLLVSGEIIPITLMIILILFNGICPYIKYRFRNLKLLCSVFIPFLVLLSVLIFFVIQANVTLAIPLIAFLLWALYDVSYYFRLMKMNR